MNLWFYAAGNGQQAGPVDDAGLAALVRGGTVGAGTLVWRRGMPAWQSYAEVWSALNAGARPVPEFQVGGAVLSSPVGFDGRGGGTALLASPATVTAPAAALVPLTRCVECSGVFPVEDTVGLQEGPVCARCKPIALQRLREGVPPRTAFRFAGFWIRVGASTLDFFIKLPVTLGIQFLYYGVFGGSIFGLRFDDAAAVATWALLNLVQIVFDRGYGWFFVGRFGATPGKMVCGLRVIRSDGSRLTYGRAFGRTMAKWLSAWTIGIGYLAVAFDEQRRGLHDHVADTRVIYK